MNSHTHQQLMRVPIVAYFNEPLALSVIFILALWLGVQWYLRMVDYIPLLTNEVEPLVI